MKLLDKFMHFVGLGPEDGFEDDPVVMPQQPKELQDNYVPTVSTSDEPLTIPSTTMYMIFDKVVEITNAAIPDYFAKSVNPDSQKKYLFEALDASVKSYIAGLEQQAQERCMALWQSERDELKREMDNLKVRTKELEAKRAEINEQKVSADRQRQALSQRVHVLDAKVMELEAEKEQLEIERSSLINKAKVASVHESDNEAMRQEIESLRRMLADKDGDGQITIATTEIDDLRSQYETMSADYKEVMGKIDTVESELAAARDELMSAKQQLSASQSEVSALQSDLSGSQEQISDLQGQLTEANRKLESVQAEVAKLEDENKTLSDTIDNFKAKDEVGDALMHDLRKKAAESVNDAKEAQDSIRRLQDEVSLRDAQIKDLQKTIEEKDAQLEDDERAFLELEQLSVQMDMFNDIKQKLEAKIAEYREALRIAHKENDTLRSTIKSNLLSQAQDHKAMLDEIESLRAQLAQN